MRIVSVAEMKTIERRADEAGVSYLQMMENAGTAAYAAILRHVPEAKRFVIVAGKGNNGGDGFVIARLAALDGHSVRVILAEGQPVTQDAQYNFERLHALPVTVRLLEDAETIADAEVIVDALYGTGFHGALRPSGQKACALMNGSGAFVAALDIPSGLHADTGFAAEGAVHAALTVAFDSYKRVHVTDDALPYCGALELADIGVPSACRTDQEL